MADWVDDVTISMLLQETEGLMRAMSLKDVLLDFLLFDPAERVGVLLLLLSVRIP